MGGSDGAQRTQPCIAGGSRGSCEPRVTVTGFFVRLAGTGDSRPGGERVISPRRSRPQRRLARAFRGIIRSRPVILAAGFAAFGLVPLVALAFVAVGTGGNAVKVNVKDSLRVSSRLSALYVQSELTGLGHVTQSFANRLLLIDALERRSRGQSTEADRAYVRRMLRQLRAVRPGIGTAFLASSNGTLVDIVPETPSIIGKDFRFRDWYKGVTRTGDVYVSEIYQSQATGHPQVVAVAAPVMTFGTRPHAELGHRHHPDQHEVRPRRIGILVAAYEASRLQGFVHAAARAQRLDVRITDQRGVAIAAGPTARTSLKGDPLVAAALAGRSGVSERDSTGGREVAAYEPLPKLGWTAIAVVPAEIAYARVAGLRSRVFLIASLLGSVFLLGAWVLARMLRARYRAEDEMLAALDKARRLGAENLTMLEATQSQNERLRELDGMKDDFVASVSHELRTPLTSIRGYLEVVREGEAGELTVEAQHFLGVVDRNAERLQRVVGDLLFVAEVDAGKVSLELRPVNLRELAEDAIEATRLAATGKDVELRLEADDLPEVEADGARLCQVLDNLISNAVKFTPAGGHVTLRTFARDGLAVIEVVDDGMGIPPEEQASLFERFFRAAGATKAAIQGTGLGLAIVQAIVIAHGGQIFLESAVGQGTTFRVELPISRVPDKVAA